MLLISHCATCVTSWTLCAVPVHVIDTGCQHLVGYNFIASFIFNHQHPDVRLEKEYLQNDMHGFLISLNSKYSMFSYTLHGQHTYINTKNVLMSRVYEHICEG